MADIGIKLIACTPGEDCIRPEIDHFTKLIPAGGVPQNGPLEATLEIQASSWQDLTDPFAKLAQALDVDVVIGATYYDSCVALIKSFGDVKYYPRSLAVSACVGNPKMYNAVGKDLRWISGPTQWDKRLTGQDYQETSLLPVHHYTKDASDTPSPVQFYNAFEEKWGIGPSYQFAAVMAGLYHLEGAVKTAGIEDTSALLTAMNDFLSPSFFGQIAVDKFGRNTVRQSIIIDYDDKAVANIVAPLFAARTDHKYPIPSAESRLRNKQCALGMQIEGSNEFCLDGDGDESIYGPYGEFCGTWCEKCLPGQYVSEPGSLECSTCPTNSYSVLPGSSECTPCPIGQSTNKTSGATGCLDCPPGYSNDAPGSDCKPCPAGSFSLWQAGECTFCKELPGFFYQPEGMQSLCLPCPANTQNSGSNGVSIDDCVCIAGFWRPDGQSGAPCVICPEGATCAGGPQQTQPKTIDGYWVSVHDNGTLRGFPFDMSRHAVSLDLGFLDKEIFFRCANQAACKSNNTCADTWDQNSAMCRQCHPQLHNVVGICLSCPGGAALTIVEWIIVISLWQAIQYLCKLFPSINMLLLYCQLLSITQGFNVPWPSELYQLAQVMSIINFNMDVVTPTCAGVHWNFYSTFYFTLLLPFLFGIGHLLWIGLAYLWMKNVGRRTAFGGLHLPCFVSTQDEFHHLRVLSFSNWLAFLVILYNAQCTSLFQAFECFPMADGSFALRADPDQVCHDRQHVTAMFIAVLGIIVFVVGVPVCMFWALYRMRKTNMLKDSDNLDILGFLYTDYEPGFWFWEILINVRRLILCFVVVIFYQWPSFQLAFGLICTIWSICIQYYWRPFRQREINWLESVELLSSLLSSHVMLCEDRWRKRLHFTLDS